MTNSKHTKRALLASVLSVVLCCAMLVGSTFAWFTDSVTSGNNKIVAGNLEIELEYKDKTGKWQTITEDTNLFKSADETLWEPGHTEYVQLRIRNAGSLALRYQFIANVYGDENGGPEKEYTNQNNEKFKLSEYLVFNKIEGDAPVEDREDLWLSGDAEKAAMGKLDDLVGNGLLTSGEEETLTLAVYMPTFVGNDANHSSSAKETEGEPTIYLGLTLNATQAPYENDSFGNDYDKAAAVTTEDELIKAVKNGGTVVLWDDIELNTNLALTENETVLDLNGHTVTFDEDGLIDLSGDASLTIKGGTFDMPTDTTSQLGYLVRAEGNSKVVIENGVFNAGLTCVQAGDNAQVEIKGGTYSAFATYKNEYWLLNLIDEDRETTNITVCGGTFINFDPSNNVCEGNGTNFVAEGYQSTEVSEGKYVVTDVNTTPAEDATGLQEAIGGAEDGGTILVTGNIESTGTILRLDASKSITVDLGRNTLTTTGTTAVVKNGGKLTIKNGTIKATVDGINVQSATLALENVTIDSGRVGVFGNNERNTITIDGCTINSSYWGVYQNGSKTPSTYTIKNTTIRDKSPTGAGIFISNSAVGEKQTLIVENCNISGSTAVEVKHTNATITGSTLTATEVENKKAYINGNGSCAIGYSLAVTSNGTNDNATGIVTVTGSTLNSEYFVYTLAEGSSVTIDGTEAQETDSYYSGNI